jgi:phosphate transport system permease protein
VATILAMLPVMALVVIVTSTLARSLPAFRELGLSGLAAADLVSPLARATNVTYGLQAPLWGSILVTAVAVGLALPAALALALVATEFRVPLVSDALSGILGTLAGIPPIIYALGAFFLVQTFMAPKFAAVELSDLRLKAVLQGLPTFRQIALPQQMPNSTLLGGVLLALLIVPLMTPLVDDALRAVPVELKYASFALGAGRWHTLLHVTFPWALPGIVAATSLGILVALGEVVIPFFVIGGAVNPIHLTNPLWDVIDHTPPLTSTGASLIGGVGGEGEGIKDLAIAVSYATGVLLLLLAVSIMAVEQLLQRYLRRRLNP